MIARGEIAVVRVGERGVRIREDVLMKWIESRQERA